MPEYSLKFSNKLLDAAQIVVSNDLESLEAKQTVLYLSLLSCEITIRALLEQAGKTLREIKSCSHDLSKLLLKLGECEVYVEISNKRCKWVSASGLRAVVVNPEYGNATVDTLLEAESNGASRYPTEIRYGDSIRHYPHDIIFEAALKNLEWARENWQNIRFVPPDT